MFPKRKKEGEKSINYSGNGNECIINIVLKTSKQNKTRINHTDSKIIHYDKTQSKL